MTKILYANHFTQGHLVQFDTKGINANDIQNSTTIDFVIPSGGTAETGSVMPASGKFVGMILHVRTNTAFLGPSVYRIVRFSFSDGYATKKTLGFISVPKGETGCFYSDPDTSDGVREWFEYDRIEFEKEKFDDGINQGLTDVEVVLGLETDVGDLANHTYDPNKLGGFDDTI